MGCLFILLILQSAWATSAQHLMHLQKEKWDARRRSSQGGDYGYGWQQGKRQNSWMSAGGPLAITYILAATARSLVAEMRLRAVAASYSHTAL